MSATATYAAIRGLGAFVLTTGEVAARRRVSVSSASRSLRRLAAQGLISRVRQGLWTLTSDAVDPRRLAPELTRPFPAYVSFQSALAAHGALDQIPREITIASLAKPRRVRTDVASYVIHRLPPELFGGFDERDGVPQAGIEKALFDYFYVAVASGHPSRRLPELDLPEGFSRKRLDRWVARIRSARLRTLVASALERALEHADYADPKRPMTATAATGVRGAQMHVTDARRRKARRRRVRQRQTA